MTPIQKPDICFKISSDYNDIIDLRTSNHFKNDYSLNCVTDFFVSIIDRTTSYFHKYGYSYDDIFEFEQDIKALIQSSPSDNLMNDLIIKYSKLFPTYYENSNEVIYSQEEGLLTFSAEQYGDFYLQWTILLITNQIIDKLDSETALKVINVLFRDLYSEIN